MTTVRPATDGDESAIAHLALANRMFAVDELGDLARMFREAMTGGLEGHRWWISTTGSGDVVGAALVAPEPFADRLWNLYFLAVSPASHGMGSGTRLLAHVEDDLRRAGSDVARVLLVETSSLEQYEGARGFYSSRGFDEEARIRDFYGPADNKVVFWKALTRQGQRTSPRPAKGVREG
jgi:ribosomal protein S18 acetylase RimI-like enzyme